MSIKFFFEKYIKPYLFSIAIIFLILWILSNFNSNKYYLAFIIGYIIVGVIADLILREFVYWVWKKTDKSHKGFEIKYTEKEIDKGLNSEQRKFFAWAPRLVGNFERILYTSAVITDKYELIGVWLVLKGIGEWSDTRSQKIDSIGRVRANNFLIGTSLSLIFGILGGILFRVIIEPSYLINLIELMY